MVHAVDISLWLKVRSRKMSSEEEKKKIIYFGPNLRCDITTTFLIISTKQNKNKQNSPE